MNFPHDRIENGVAIPCDGDFIDVSTFKYPNRFLCPKCRAVRQGTTRDPIDDEPMGPPATPASPTVEKEGWIRTLLRWFW